MVMVEYYDRYAATNTPAAIHGSAKKTTILYAHTPASTVDKVKHIPPIAVIPQG